MRSSDPVMHRLDTGPRRRLRTGSLIKWAILIAVLSLAFIGHLTPDMRVQWANLMTLCGF